MSRAGLTFSHFGMFVFDLEAMTDFYERALEFTVTDRGQLPAANGSRNVVFLSRDPTEHHQLVLVSGRPRTLDFNPINQISLQADSLTTLLAMYRRMALENVSDMTPVTHGNALSLYLRDPEGNRLELYIDLPWYVSQPHVVKIDLDGSEAAIMQNAETYARSLPGFLPRAEWSRRMAGRMGLP